MRVHNYTPEHLSQREWQEEMLKRVTRMESRLCALMIGLGINPYERTDKEDIEAGAGGASGIGHPRG